MRYRYTAIMYVHPRHVHYRSPCTCTAHDMIRYCCEHAGGATQNTPWPHLMNQPSKKGCREDFGGGRGSKGDAPTTCGDALSVPPPSKKAPMMDTTPRLFSPAFVAAGNTLLAAAFACGAAVVLLPGSPAAFRLPLRRRARQGDDQAAVRFAAPGTTEVDLLSGLGVVAPPLSDSTCGMLLASGARLLLPPAL